VESDTRGEYYQNYATLVSYLEKGAPDRRLSRSSKVL
jgi:hypothetical protein